MDFARVKSVLSNEVEFSQALQKLYPTQVRFDLTNSQRTARGVLALLQGDKSAMSRSREVALLEAAFSLFGARTILLHVKLEPWVFRDRFTQRWFTGHEFVLFWSAWEQQLYLYHSYSGHFTLASWIATQRHIIVDRREWCNSFISLFKSPNFNAQLYGKLFGIVHTDLFDAPLLTTHGASTAQRGHLTADALQFQLFC